MLFWSVFYGLNDVKLSAQRIHRSMPRYFLDPNRLNHEVRSLGTIWSLARILKEDSNSQFHSFICWEIPRLCASPWLSGKGRSFESRSRVCTHAGTYSSCVFSKRQTENLPLLPLVIKGAIIFSDPKVCSITSFIRWDYNEIWYYSEMHAPTNQQRQCRFITSKLRRRQTALHPGPWAYVFKCASAWPVARSIRQPRVTMIVWQGQQVLFCA